LSINRISMDESLHFSAFAALAAVEKVNFPLRARIVPCQAETHEFRCVALPPESFP